MPRASRLELDLAPPEKLSHTIGVRVLDATLAQELVSLRDGGYLSPLHGFLELLESFGRDQLLATAFVYSAFEQLLETTLPITGKPPLALAPAVAQSVCCLSQVGAFPRLQEPKSILTRWNRWV